jgi:hypothetical protein
MLMPYEEHIDPRSVECAELFSWCCQRDDKNESQQRMKQEEERGEFFREYLIWDAKRTGVVAMAHRETTTAMIHEEMIDCIVTTARCVGMPEFFFRRPEVGNEHSYASFAKCFRFDHVCVMIEVASALMGEDEFYRVLLAKLNKWKTILLLNGLETL